MSLPDDDTFTCSCSAFGTVANRPARHASETAHRTLRTSPELKARENMTRVALNVLHWSVPMKVEIPHQNGTFTMPDTCSASALLIDAQHVPGASELLRTSYD
jgi:hypothetical protein